MAVFSALNIFSSCFSKKESKEDAKTEKVVLS